MRILDARASGITFGLVLVILVFLLLLGRTPETGAYLFGQSYTFSDKDAQFVAKDDKSDINDILNRGIKHLAMGKTRLALHDFNHVLQLKPDWHVARLHRGAAYIQMGEFELAHHDFDDVLYDDPYNAVARTHHRSIGVAEEHWEEAQDLVSIGAHETALPVLTLLLQMSPWSIPYRQLRVDVYAAMDNLDMAISDMRMVIELSMDTTDIYHKLASLLYRNGNVDDAIDALRQCLRLDPKHESCLLQHETARYIQTSMADAEQAKQSGDYQECISAANNAQSMGRLVPMITFQALRLRCSCYLIDGRYSKALTPCTSALAIKTDTRVLCNRAAAYFALETYSEALRDYGQALRIDANLYCAQRGILVAMQAQKKAAKKNYYEILGVKWSASKQEIHRAYRRVAQKWHPDNFKAEDKKFAEGKFLDIVTAKNILTDPRKRELYDRGEDPIGDSVVYSYANFQ